MFKKPNLFIVGAPKCGTTSLHYCLKKHPEVFMSEIKEPNYFCKDFHREADNFIGAENDFFRYKNEEEYLNIFKNVGGQNIIGESSVRYYFSKEAAQNIYNFNSQAKIIIMLRSPVDMIKSQHAQFVKSGHEKMDNFEKAISLENNRRAGSNIPNNLDQPSLLYYSDIGFIERNIKRYLDLFPRENIKIILLDDFKDDVGSVYKKVLEFLKIDNDFKPNFKHKNARALPRFKFITSFFKSNSFLKKIARKIISHKNRERLYYFIEKLNNKKIKDNQKLKIDYKIERELKNKFKDDVKFLSDLLDRNLVEKWDY